jgi:hypothetical protein
MNQGRAAGSVSEFQCQPIRPHESGNNRLGRFPFSLTHLNELAPGNLATKVVFF